MTTEVQTPSIDAGDAAAAANLPQGGRRISADDLKARIVDEQFYCAKTNPRTTICELMLDNGFVLVGMSGCADPAVYDWEKGKVFAKENALKQLWPILGFLLTDQIAKGL